MYQLYNHALLDPYKAFERFHTRDQIENWLKNITNKTITEIRNQKSSNVKSVIAKANAFLSTNYSRPDLTLTAISDHVFLSPTYFSRLYKKETGESYVEALTRIRLDMAKKLLRETDRKISVISESVGYTESKYFCGLFKKYMGLTPLEYREMQIA